MNGNNGKKYVQYLVLRGRALKKKYLSKIKIFLKL